MKSSLKADLDRIYLVTWSGLAMMGLFALVALPYGLSHRIFAPWTLKTPGLALLLASTALYLALLAWVIFRLRTRAHRKISRLFDTQHLHLVKAQVLHRRHSLWVQRAQRQQQSCERLRNHLLQERHHADTLNKSFATERQALHSQLDELKVSIQSQSSELERVHKRLRQETRFAEDTYRAYLELKTRQG